MQSGDLDYWIQSIIPNEDQTSFTFEKENHPFQLMIFFNAFNNYTFWQNDFDIFRDNESKLIHGNLNIDGEKLQKYVVPALIMEKYEDGKIIQQYQSIFGNCDDDDFDFTHEDVSYNPFNKTFYYETKLCPELAEYNIKNE